MLDIAAAMCSQVNVVLSKFKHTLTVTLSAFDGRLQIQDVFLVLQLWYLSIKGNNLTGTLPDTWDGSLEASVSAMLL